MYCMHYVASGKIGANNGNVKMRQALLFVRWICSLRNLNIFFYSTSFSPTMFFFSLLPPLLVLLLLWKHITNLNYNLKKKSGKEQGKQTENCELKQIERHKIEMRIVQKRERKKTSEQVEASSAFLLLLKYYRYAPTVLLSFRERALHNPIPKTTISCSVFFYSFL